MFTDKVFLELESGDGGDGIVAWRREKYLPKGGPTGGDGGKGGDVLFRADNHQACLLPYRRSRLLKATRGKPGGPNCQSGHSGDSLVLKVPCGTVIRDRETREVLVDLESHGQEFCILKGGSGGRGNASFKSSTNQAPRESTPGKPGETREVELELKLIADVGLVGLPNAGKSSFLRIAARVDAKSAPYPFTTLSPNLGMVEFSDLSRIFFADIPGIIEGASQNRGLGLEFLRHIERCPMLLFVLDGSGFAPMTPADSYRTLRTELLAYDPHLMDRPHFVLFNKIDVEGWEERLEEFKVEFPECAQVYPISTLSGQGLKDVLNAVRWEIPACRSAHSSN